MDQVVLSLMFKVVMEVLLLHQVYNPAQEEVEVVLTLVNQEFNLLNKADLVVQAEVLEVVMEILLVEEQVLLVKVITEEEQMEIMQVGAVEKVLLAQLILVEMDKQIQLQVLL